MKYLLLFLFSISIFAKVTKEDWDIKADPSKEIEHAVILYEKGLIDETFTRELSIERTDVKIKFLSKKGIEDYGTLKLSYTPPRENISGIKGTVYLPDGQTIKLKKEDIHKKKVSKEYGLKETEISVVFPGLVEGAIVEYSYDRSFKGMQRMYYWSFQSSLYCYHSEVTYISWPTLPWGVSFTNLTEDPIIKRGKHNKSKSIHITRKHVPPLKKEAYSLPVESKRESAWFYHKDENAKSNKFWETRGLRFYKTKLKKMFKPRKFLEGELTIEPGNPDTVNQIYEHVLSKHVSILAATEEESSKLDEKYLEKLSKADSLSKLSKLKYLYESQMDFILGAYIATYLPEAKIEFVFYTPWDKGFFNPNIRTLDQFEETMLKVTYMDKVYWLCPARRLLPINQLPFGAYSNQLYVINSQKAYFEPTKPLDYRKSITEVELDFTLNEDGDQATVIRKKTLSPFDSYYQRSYLFYHDEKETRDRLLEKLQEEFGSDMELTEFKVENLKTIDQPLIIEETFTIPVELEEAGDYLMLKPAGLFQFTKNPFNKEKRKLDVIFPYPFQTHRTATYHLGENFVFKKVPKGTRVNESAFTFKMNYEKLDDHNFKVSNTLTLEQNFFKHTSGRFFRDSIDPMLKATTQPIVIEEAE
ncbi:MAG: hypothetical protein CR997_02465 [Acidobacteria bacterium]|nr:MAG: hypothetical protein CR997_02465 [Acidobacteriota bacterium]